MLSRRVRTVLVISVLVLSFHVRTASTQPWALPHHMFDVNTKVSFSVDSTWHTVHGTTSGITGSITQADPADPLSIVADLSIPVASFDTARESRDERLREVMDQPHYPVVRFTSSRLSPTCHPLRVMQNRRCSGTLDGILSIRDVSRAIALPIEIELKDEEFAIHGALEIAWKDYHVEDPSILIATLAPTVTISYSITIPKQPPR